MVVANNLNLVNITDLFANWRNFILLCLNLRHLGLYDLMCNINCKFSFDICQNRISLLLQKLQKMFSISSKKLFSFSRYSNFCIFPFLSIFARFIWWDETGIIMALWNGFYKSAITISGIAQKPLCIKSLKLARNFSEHVL